jgi:hypothetical protein
MARQICVYVEDWQFEKLQKEGNKSEVARKAFDLYYKKEEKEMKIIETVELTKSGVKVSDQDNPMAVRYFNDNGNLPDGNFDESQIAGEWVHLEGKHTNLETYAYRSIDNSTLVPVDIFREKMIKEMEGESVIVDAEWIEENDPHLLDWITSSNYWGRGYDFTPERSEAIVELQFDEEGVRYYGDFESRETSDKYPSQNQGPWGEDEWEDWGDIEQLKKYYLLVKNNG